MAAAPESAETSKGLIGWIDRRFPLTALWRSQVSEYYAPKNFNFWYYFGSLALLVLANQIDHGNLPDDELQALGDRSVRIDRIHHARRQLGLDDPLSAYDRRLGFLHRRLSAHVPCAALWLAPQAARVAVDIRLPDILGADGRGLHGLCAAVGQHELLGRASDRLLVRQPAGDRRRLGRLDPRRLRDRRCHAQPLLCAARGGPAARAHISRDRASDGAT